MFPELKREYIACVCSGRIKRRFTVYLCIIFMSDLQVSDVDNVYEVVDEKEYSERRQERLEDDWIVDDGMNLFFF